MGFYMSIELQRGGYIGSVSCINQKGNGNGLPFSSVVQISEDGGNSVVTYNAGQNKRPSTRRTLYADVRENAESVNPNAQPSDNSIRQLSENSQDENSSGTIFSLCDSTGRELTEAQQEYFKDSKAAEQLAKENRSLARRIADWLRKWVRSIKTAMEDLKAERPESAAMMQYAEELQKLWDDALVTAARNNRGVGTGRAQYSIRTMDGETMTVLDTENDTRSFDAAEEYLKALVDTGHPFATILADAQPVYIGKDLPGEYRSSEYTKGMEAKLRPVKMQAATNLDEMLLLAENGEWRENVKDKHKTDAQNGWYRYDARFAVPILNEKKAVDHYTVYGGTLLIRNDADGKSYLYDLVDIKREKRISTASFSARGHSELLAPKPSQTQYMQNAEGSQAEKSGQMKEEAFPKLMALPENPALSGGMLL